MNLDHVFIDLAVSDPDPEKGEIVAMAVVRTDHQGKVLAAFSDTCGSDHSFDEPRFAQCIHRMQDTILAKNLQVSYIVVAHGPDDRRFLRAAYGRLKEKDSEVFPKRSWLDTSQLAWPFVYNDMASERTLESLCVHFGVPFDPETADSAMGDCERLVRLYWTMMGRYRLALKGEQMARDVGGDLFGRASSFLGKLF